MGNAQDPSLETLADIDQRLFDLFTEAIEVEDWTWDTVCVFLRAAYGKGHRDAMEEKDPGALYKRHGYRIPRRIGKKK